jgi:galactokinase/mevalonate kinase-like predicted kinase
VVEFDYAGQQAGASGQGWAITLVIPGDTQPQRRAYIGKKLKLNPGDSVNVIFDPQGNQTAVFAVSALRYAALGPGPGAIG